MEGWVDGWKKGRKGGMKVPVLPLPPLLRGSGAGGTAVNLANGRKKGRKEGRKEIANEGRKEYFKQRKGVGVRK